MHRQDPLHHHRKPSPGSRFKFTITAVILFSVMCGILAAQLGKGAWWYIIACIAATILVFIGESFR